MSDIAITFPTWTTPLLIAMLYWPVLLVAAIVLVGLAMVVRGWLRTALFGLATVASLPCLVLSVMGLVDAVDSASHAVSGRGPTRL
jgi:hypothetical protein